MTRSESQQLAKLLRHLETALDCRVVFSSVMRALMRMAFLNQDSILASASEHEGELSVPQRGNEPALIDYAAVRHDILQFPARVLAIIADRAPNSRRSPTRLGPEDSVLS